MIQFLNYLLFSVFSFFFVLRLESDALTLAIMRLTGCSFFSHPLLIAIGVTLLLLGVRRIVSLFLSTTPSTHFLTFIPSLLVLVLLSYIAAPPSAWNYAHMLIAVTGMSFFFLKMKNQRRTIDNWKSILNLSLAGWLILLGSVALLSRTGDIPLYELRTSRLLMQNLPEKALRVGRHSLSTSQRFTALRAYALSRTGILPERLFEYPLPQGIHQLLLTREDVPQQFLPTDSLQALYGFIPTSTQAFSSLKQQMNGPSAERLKDYWLCTLLLYKQIDRFASELPLYYNVSPNNRNTLPKHYREALLLYQNHREHPILDYQPSAAEQMNYDEFLATLKQYAHPMERSNLSRRLYGTTYWWYYYFAQ